MQVPATERRHVRFGPFTVDLISRELLNNGHNIHLQEKPFQILAILLDQPGELVTREEFRQKLWPSDTFVDFEHSINTAIKKLREALEDDAERPRFIETLPRRGYRFIASVAEAPGAEARPVRPIQRQVAARAETSKTRLRRGWYVLLPGAVLVAMAALLVGLNVGGVRDRLWQRRTPAQDVAILIKSLAVLPFENLSGDSSKDYFADAFTDELITQLAEQAPIRVVSRSSVMRYKGSRKPLPEIARELNVDAIVEGSVSLSDQQVRITAQLIEAASDRHLWAHSYARDRKDLFSIQSEVAATIASLIHTKADSKHTIVFPDFDNKTGDSVFDDTLKQGLSVQLEQSPFLVLVSERRVNETLKQMGRPAGGRLTPEVTHEVCQRTGGNAMLTGSIAGLGSHYVIGLKAVNCNTGDVLAEAQEQAAGKEAVLKALDAAAISLRSKLGESLGSVQKYATPVEEATTPSLEALKAYSLGRKANLAKGNTAALSFYKRAVELDPNFAMPYAAMSIAYGNLNEAGRAVENARKAYQLREKVSERERFFIEGSYYLTATGELEKAAQVYELWQQAYPRDDLPHRDLGVVAVGLGDAEKTLEEWREALRLDPNNAVNYLNLGNQYANLNRLDEAEAVYRRAEDRKLESEYLLLNRYQLAFLKGDTAQMARLLSAAMGKPGTEDVLLAAEADTEAWYGKLKNAHELTGRAMDSAQHNDAKESAASYQAAAALREVESGNREQARAQAKAALKLAPDRGVREVAALALARAGDTARAEKLAAELDKTFPLDTLVQRYWLPTLRAGVALERKDPNRAIELLKVASPIELGPGGGTLTILMCPAYLRGEAYLMLHDGNRAAAEFQKFIDHRGLVVNFPWGALARLGIARAYALQGDTAKARAAYQDFLTLWKDADRDIPILKEAKAEYAKLQ
jgi:TolB-like protein/DNA-binding winged helix-turn-helix (wHTH) protein/tetratricopeptide (TPR) repeat protein